MRKFKVKYYETKYSNNHESSWEEVIEKEIEAKYFFTENRMAIFKDLKGYSVKAAFTNFISVEEVENE